MAYFYRYLQEISNLPLTANEATWNAQLLLPYSKLWNGIERLNFMTMIMKALLICFFLNFTTLKKLNFNENENERKEIND